MIKGRIQAQNLRRHHFPVTAPSRCPAPRRKQKPRGQSAYNFTRGKETPKSFREKTCRFHTRSRSQNGTGLLAYGTESLERRPCQSKGKIIFKPEFDIQLNYQSISGIECRHFQTSGVLDRLRRWAEGEERVARLSTSRPRQEVGRKATSGPMCKLNVGREAPGATARPLGVESGTERLSQRTAMWRRKP